jgi:UDP-glucose 4-epimerase
MTGMKVLVTGGAGYIGSHTVGLLRARGDQVVVLDSLELGYRQAIADQGLQDTPIVVGNTRDEDLVRKVLREHGIEAVIHFAAYKAAGESVGNPGKYFDNNVHGTMKLLEAMRQEGVKKFVFSSTAAVYGNPEVLPVVETAALRPENPYGESKLQVERMLPWYDQAFGLKWVALRYFNAAGAVLDGRIGEDPRYATNLIPLVMKAAVGRAPAIKVFGTDYPTPDGTCIRDYIHVLDLADAHLKALDYLAAGHSDIFNLGTGKGASVKEVLAVATQAAGKPIPTEFVARRPGDPVSVYADNAKARTLLKWTPRYGLNEIVDSAWKWHSTHPDGFRTT